MCRMTTVRVSNSRSGQRENKVRCGGRQKDGRPENSVLLDTIPEKTLVPAVVSSETTTGGASGRKRLRFERTVSRYG